MDPKQLNQLDPKLKAAYDRVMSTTVTPTAAAQPPKPAASIPTVPAAPAIPSPTIAAPIPPAQPTKPHPTTLPASHPAVADAPEKDRKKVSSILLIAGGIIFIAVYAMLWMNFFQIPIPFLSQ